MAGKQSVQLHHLVSAVLDEFELTQAGPRLPADRLRHWAREMITHPDHEELTNHLLVVAGRFAKAHAEFAAVQIVALAALALGSQQAEQIATATGTDLAKARKLLGKELPTLGSPESSLPAPKANTKERRGRRR